MENENKRINPSAESADLHRPEETGAPYAAAGQADAAEEKQDMGLSAEPQDNPSAAEGPASGGGPAWQEPAGEGVQQDAAPAPEAPDAISVTPSCAAAEAAETPVPDLGFPPEPPAQPSVPEQSGEGAPPPPAAPAFYQNPAQSVPPQAAQVPPAGAYGPAVPVWPGPPQGTYSGIQGGYGAPPYGAAYYGAPQAYYGVPYPGYGAPPPKPPRKKMGLGLKVFLWIASVLAAGTILGFTGFLVYSSVTNSYGPHYTLPEPGEDTPDDGEKTPDFGMEPPEDEEDDSNKPDVDITPNHEGITIQKKPEGAELDAKGVYNKVAPSTVTVVASLTKNGQEASSTGTGIIATSDGYIITNSHVVINSKSTTVKITTFDEQEYDAVVVGVDRTTDLAILKTNDHNFTPAEFGEAEELSIGEWVVAIGNPGGVRFSGSLTRGVISNLNRTVGQYSENGMTYIQTDAAINPGNSGGPLVNMYGQVVGINSSKIITDGYEGMGFAIPVSKAQAIINELLSGGYVKGRTRLGIQGKDVSAMQMMYGAPQGFVIMSIDSESAFSGTAAEDGDIITALDGEEVTGLSDISNLLLRYAPGDKVKITLYRMPSNSMAEGETFDVEITLLEDKGETQN